MPDPTTPDPTDRTLQARTLLDAIAHDLAHDEERRREKLRQLLDLYPEVEPFWCDQDGRPTPKGWYVGFRLADKQPLEIGCPEGSALAKEPAE